METYLLIFFRIVSILLLLVLLMLFVMGKRSIGELPVFDFLVLVIIGAVVGADIADPKIEHLPTAFAIIIIAFMQRLFSYLNLRYKKFRKFFTFDPTVILYNGKLIYKNIKKIHYNADEILMMLREKEIFDLSKIEYAIIEANGKISILKKSENESITVQDMKVSCPGSNSTVAIILDGQLQEENIKSLNYKNTDIILMLAKLGYKNKDEIFYASINSSGSLNVSSYNECLQDIFSAKK